MVPKVTWPQALAWRMRRQFLTPASGRSSAEVVRRLCGVQAQVASFAEVAIRVRRETSKPGDVDRALHDGRLIKTWAMRGTLHLLTPEDAGAFLSLIAAGRAWERPSWERYFGVSPKQIESLRAVIRDALDGTVLTREELIAAVTATRGFGHVGDAFRSGWGTLLKPFAWQGDLCFGPRRGNRVTFTLPSAATTRWAGLPAADEAAPVAMAAYLRAYGPATAAGFANWLSRGRTPMRRLRRWFDELRPRLAEVEVGGERAYVRAADLDDLVATRPTTALRLLPGFDPFVLGPGTDDPHVVPPHRRAAVSRQAGWISPVVLSAGVVRGTWELRGDRVAVAWFTENGPPPKAALRSAVNRLGTIVGQPLELEARLA